MNSGHSLSISKTRRYKFNSIDIAATKIPFTCFESIELIRNTNSHSSEKASMAVVRHGEHLRESNHSDNAVGALVQGYGVWGMDMNM